MSRPDSPARRRFLQHAAGLAAGAALAPEPAAAQPAAALLPTIALGPHQVTRLIVGGNPVYGHSHFNKLFSRHMTDWHTPERVLSLLQRCEQVGINAWQNSYADRTLEDLDRYRSAGGKMHWLCLGKPDWDRHPERIADAARRKPIGIAPHGALAERLHRQGKLGVLHDLLKRIRDQGVLVGLSAHNPARRVDTPAAVRQAIATALANIKPTDALIVGMYQQFGDQVGENAATVRELCGKPA
jgi:hypothetical protein